MHHGAALSAHGVVPDPTTGLLARSAFDEALDVELERARRVRGSVGLLLIELELPDDRAERESGLRNSGRALKAEKRCYDSAARVGEARLAVVAPDSDEHGAYII